MKKKGPSLLDGLKEHCRRYRELREKHKGPDVRTALVVELLNAILFGDPALERRYNNETAFAARLDSGWRR